MIATVRSIGDCPSKPKNTDLDTKIYKIQVITPLFGGGVDEGLCDSVTLIRPSSVRGHLRFWWRATRGTRFDAVDKLRQREGMIWGTTENPSPFSIEVISQKNLSELSVRTSTNYYGFQRFGPEAYVLFPARQNNSILCKEGISFVLVIRWQNKERSLELKNEIYPDIEAAIWAWVNFGGIGSRTRRGCGALFCGELAPKSDVDLNEWYSQNLIKYGILTKSTPRSWPTLPSKLLIHPRSVNPMIAWSSAIDLLRKFRQGENVGRYPGKGKHPSRSMWPEPDSLRKITGKGDSRHLRSVTLSFIEDEPAFPRAELGLPIVFHFMGDDGINNSRLHPFDKMKGSKQPTRMSSPIILRPLLFNDGINAKAMAICLIAQRPNGVILEGDETGINRYNELHIRRAALAIYPKSPMGVPGPGKPMRSSSGSALDAFIEFSQEIGNDFVRVG